MTNINPWADGIKPNGADIATIKARLPTIDLHWDASTNIPKYFAVVGTWVVVVDATIVPGIRLHQNPAAQNNEIRFELFAKTLDPVTLNIMGSTQSTFGISTISINGVSQGTLDWYDAGGASGVIKTITITPAQIGMNTLSFLMATKHNNSTDYELSINGMWI